MQMGRATGEHDCTIRKHFYFSFLLLAMTRQWSPGMKKDVRNHALEPIREEGGTKGV